jgi:RNA polymerase sigma factor (sigma-70 family)
MGRKYCGHYLDEKRKELAEVNFNLVWFYIGQIVNKRLIEPREIDEFAGYAVFYYCLACETFDFSKNYKFSTYLFKALNSSLSVYKEYTKRYSDRFLSLEYSENEDSDYSRNKIDPVYKEHNKNFVVSDKIDNVVNNSGLDQFENQIIYYKYKLNLSSFDMAKIFGMPEHKIKKMHFLAIQKIKDFVNKNQYCFEDFFEEMSVA